MNFKKFLQILIILSFSILPFGARATMLYFEPGTADYHPGDTFIVNVRIDTQGECINTIQTNLAFSNDILVVKDLAIGSSIISVWINTPGFSNKTGSISFAGGIPAGYCGRLPGDPGESNLIGKIIFQVKDQTENHEAEVEFLESSQVLLNDGLGTRAELTTKKAVFSILAGIPGVPREEWQIELSNDKIPPDPFVIEINRDPSIFEGKYFIIFSTTDKQTGLDYYEVKEGEGGWKRAESPYLLEDQSLESAIKVRAVDKAGNERIAEYVPPKKQPSPYWIIILVLVGGGIVLLILRKIITKNKSEIL
jgi:hypothetical protein